MANLTLVNQRGLDRLRAVVVGIAIFLAVIGSCQGNTLATATIVGPLGALAGALAAAALGGRFALRALSGVQLGRSLVGGGIMGFAIILIPEVTLPCYSAPCRVSRGTVLSPISPC